jgi:uncharacterized protein
VRHVGSVIVLPETTVPWDVSEPSDLRIESLAPVLDYEPRVEILLIGSGRDLRPIDEGIRAALSDAGIAVEPMDTGAACRTYSVLAAEDRRVAAALIAVN